MSDFDHQPLDEPDDEVSVQAEVISAAQAAMGFDSDSEPETGDPDTPQIVCGLLNGRPVRR